MVQQTYEYSNSKKVLAEYYKYVKKHHATFNDKFRLELDCDNKDDIKLIKSLQYDKLPEILKIRLGNVPE